ncbi:MAG: hypothetical protein ABUT39_11535 [Acidobacteriota bacterium]
MEPGNTVSEGLDLNRILRIDVKGFKVAVAKVPVRKPHWQLTGPTQPAAIAASAPGQATIRIALDDVAGLASMGLLIGRLGALSIRGRCRLVAGEQEVAAEILGDPSGGFQRHAGDAEWSILPDGAPAPLALEPRTPLEIFELFGKPRPFYCDAIGVWVEVLRFLADPGVGLAGLAMQPAVGQIARFCHQDHGLRYNTQNGKASFFPGTVEAIFQLSRYLQAGALQPVNCYDQAAAIQALAGALGIKVQYRFLQPCGHINVVDLVGVGLCNNPFFENPHGSFPAQPIVVAGTPRSSFANHTFSQLEDQVYDACAGPPVGVHPPGAYLARLIDDTVPQVHGGLANIVAATEGVLKVV